MTGEKALREALRELGLSRQRHGGVVRRSSDEGPGCAYGYIVEERLTDIAGDVEALRAEVMWMRRVVLTGVVSGALAALLRYL